MSRLLLLCCFVIPVVVMWLFVLGVLRWHPNSYDSIVFIG